MAKLYKQKDQDQKNRKQKTNHCVLRDKAKETNQTNQGFKIKSKSSPKKME